jgi:hypothetical protein
LPPSSPSHCLLAAVIVVISHASFAAVVVDLILPSCRRGRPPPALQDGILRYKNRVVIGPSTDLTNKIFASFHASIFGGHSGQRVTLHRIKQIFYWPNLKKDIVEKVAQCPVCQLFKTEHVQYPGLLNLLQIPSAKWSDISMDFVEALPKSRYKIRSNRYASFPFFCLNKFWICRKYILNENFV